MSRTCSSGHNMVAYNVLCYPRRLSVSQWAPTTLLILVLTSRCQGSRERMNRDGINHQRSSNLFGKTKVTYRRQFKNNDSVPGRGWPEKESTELGGRRGDSTPVLTIIPLQFLPEAKEPQVLGPQFKPKILTHQVTIIYCPDWITSESERGLHEVLFQDSWNTLGLSCANQETNLSQLLYF